MPHHQPQAVPSHRVDPSREGGQSSIAAGPVVDLGPVRVDQVTAQGRSRMDLAVHAGPCTQPGPSPAELPAPADVLVSVLRGRALALVLVLVPPALASVPQVASRRLPAKLRGRRERLRSNVVDASNIPRPKKAQ
jgi:hypothetical protein